VQVHYAKYASYLWPRTLLKKKQKIKFRNNSGKTSDTYDDDGDDKRD
jgi:hypothetical protein